MFPLVGLNRDGHVVIRKRCSRTQLLAYPANLPVQVIGMEACSGSPFLGRALREPGHTVRLMPAPYVKPYVKTNKSDYLDAEAMAEAVQRPTMRFVPIKTEEQLDLQAVHRMRERWVRRRTAVVQQIRALLLERGLPLPKGRRHLEQALPAILTERAATLSGSFQLLRGQMKLELDQLKARMAQLDAAIAQTAREQDSGERLTDIPGIGPVTATALVAAVGNGAAFRKGRERAAWIGLVPREHSTGGQQKLLGISKRGHGYRRRLFVQGARAVLQQRTSQAAGLPVWLTQLSARSHHNVVVVALAHQLARRAWAVLSKEVR